jgi:hypothetical protein
MRGPPASEERAPSPPLSMASGEEDVGASNACTSRRLARGAVQSPAATRTSERATRAPAGGSHVERFHRPRRRGRRSGRRVHQPGAMVTAQTVPSSPTTSERPSSRRHPSVRASEQPTTSERPSVRASEQPTTSERLTGSPRIGSQSDRSDGSDRIGTGRSIGLLILVNPVSVRASEQPTTSERPSVRASEQPSSRAAEQPSSRAADAAESLHDRDSGPTSSSGRHPDHGPPARLVSALGRTGGR